MVSIYYFVQLDKNDSVSEEPGLVSERSALDLVSFVVVHLEALGLESMHATVRLLNHICPQIHHLTLVEGGESNTVG